MPVEEEAFERLLRLYPKAWREANGEVFLATITDDARAKGLSRPDAALWASAIVHAWGMRLNSKMAIILSGISIPLAVLYQAVYSRALLDNLGAFPLNPEDFPYEPLLRVVELLVGNLLLPILVMTAAVCFIAGRSLLTPPRALASTTVAALTSLVHMMTRMMWILAARKGQGLPDHTMEKAGNGLWWAGMLTLAIAVALIVDQLLEARVSSMFLRWVFAVLIGVSFAVMGAALVEIPLAWLVFAVPLFLASVMMEVDKRRRVAADETDRPSIRMRPVKLALSTRIAVTLLAALALVLAFMDSAFGFFPGLIHLIAGHAGAEEHSGEVASLVISACAWIGVFPMLAAWGVGESAQREDSRLHIWGPIILLMASWVMVTIMTVPPMNSSPLVHHLYDALEPVTGDPKGFGAIIVCFAPASTAAVIWMVDRFLPKALPIRLLSAVLVAFAWFFISFFIIMGTPFFFNPLLSLLVIIRVWTVRRRIPVDTQSTSHSLPRAL